MVLDKFRSLNTFILDVDGVLTKGTVLATDDDSMLREFNIKDGFALQFAVKKGYKVIIISGGNSPGVKKRLLNLGIEEVHTAIPDKVKFLSQLSKEQSIDLTKSVYMGDDYPDISVSEMCEVNTCPADAVWQIKDKCSWISEKNGGEGAVRQLIETVLTLRGDWESTSNSVW